VAKETRASKISRLRKALERVTQDAAAPWVVVDEPEYREMVEAIADPALPDDKVLDYALMAPHWEVSLAAVAAIRQRADNRATASPETRWSAAAVLWTRVDLLNDFALSEALQLFASASLDPRRPLSVLADREYVGSSAAIVLRQAYGAYFTTVEEKAPLPPADAAGNPFEKLQDESKERLRKFLSGFAHASAVRLAGELRDPDDDFIEPVPAPPPSPFTPPPPPPQPSEPGFFDKVGRFWSESDSRGALPRRTWEERLDVAMRAMYGTEPRSVLVVGERLVGKSSFLKLLALRIQRDGWKVFEAGSNDFIADNIYIGQAEGLLRQARKELHASKKIAWYVPDILNLSEGGSHKHNPTTYLDQLMGAMTTGELVLWGEATPQEAERLFRRRSTLRHFVEVVRLEPDIATQALDLLSDVADWLELDLGLVVKKPLRQHTVDLATHHLRTAALPGSAIMLLRNACRQAARDRDRTLQERHVFDALARVAGLPRDLVDDNEQLDVARVTDFFLKRVIGQPDAVRTIVERITMIKAGLTDPKRPLGVFLFAGPTGTGKTELAKATTEYLFGTADRMIRLDMSEYQTVESLSKIIGGPQLPEHSETLLDRIRQQPFSVVLLDEFEKSHWQVWDLCLQLLDEGRLTDYHGNTADFRSSLIILTTNLGATRHQPSRLGFRHAQRQYREDQVLEAISDVFRPEFQNRLDRIVAFQPLTRELMRGILAKELQRLYERPGLRQRDWAIEWEASAIEFLLERGFDPDMGARPLKRAIDQFVATPLAAAIVEHRTPVGDQFVFMRSDGQAIQAEFIDPDSDDQGAPAAEPDARSGTLTLAHIALAPKGERDEVATLADEQQKIAGQIASNEWTERKSRLTAEMHAPAFWEREDRVHVLSRLEMMDRLAVAAETAASLQGRLQGRRTLSGRPLRDVLSRLAVQLLSVQDGLRDLHEDAPVDVALAIEPALDTARDADAIRAWCVELRAMYAGWALNRHMARSDGPSLTPGGPALLVVSGFGAARTLLREAGLHVLEAPGTSASSTRIGARVLAAIVPPVNGAATPSDEALKKAFDGLSRSRAVVRRYRRKPSPLVRGRDGAWRTGRLDAVMGGHFDLFERLAGRS
jgi:ATP-dependent Clp protease ATP-binding subunit ClpC